MDANKDTIDRNKENEGGMRKYSVLLKYKFTRHYKSSEEAVDGIFSRLMEEVGSSKSMICSPISVGFYAILTKEQAKKLAENEFVQDVMPEIIYYPMKGPRMQGCYQMSYEGWEDWNKV